MANDKHAATYHGDPAQARIEDVALDRYSFDQAALDREMGESIAAPELSPEQDLRAAVAERLTDATHFNGCTDDPCTCLIGRLKWAITCETSEKPS